jgi:hypothetical protein
MAIMTVRIGRQEVVIHSYELDGEYVTIDGERRGSRYPERDGRAVVRCKFADHIRRREGLGPEKLAATLAAYWEANRNHPED